MAKKVLLSGKATLSKHGKHMVAESMWTKGLSFISASIVLKQRGGYQFVVLHLLCQGIEIVLKSLLLARDYDRYKPKLKTLGHNLEKIIESARTEFKVNKFDVDFQNELKQLNTLFSSHRLRYGSGFDIVVDPNSIPYDRVLRKTLVLMRLERKKRVFPLSPSNNSIEKMSRL